jgi:glutamyl-tRNA synthetase
MASLQNIRVRFAPSPTGNLHIGGMRTALFNYLFAKHYNGTFLIRIEDTDLERSKTEFVTTQLAALEWCGIESDEPLVFQSQRSEAYQAILEKLFEQKKIYRCVCSPETIEQRVKASGNTDEFFAYDQLCRDKNIQADCGKQFVIRFGVPENQQPIVVNDLIRGKVVFEKTQFDDFIIIRSDGSPMYNFAVVVDDAFMKITHIIRGEEHLGNTPKQIMLAQAMGFAIPECAHIPLILSPNGGKLSKRDGAVDVNQFKKDGYLSQALVNYVVRLGWAHGDEEVFTQEELVKAFTLDGVGKKGAVFDLEKLAWLNGFYLKQLTPQICLEWLVNDVCNDLKKQLNQWNTQTIEAGIKLYQERIKLGSELCAVLKALHDGPTVYDAQEIATWLTAEARIHLVVLLSELKNLADFTHDPVSELIKQFCKNQNIKLVAIAQPLRIALTGGTSSPGVFDLVALLGKETVIKRIQFLLQL